jgi:hypothetical protein
MHFHLRYLRFLLFQIPFLIRETLTAVNLRCEVRIGANSRSIREDKEQPAEHAE